MGDPTEMLSSASVEEVLAAHESLTAKRGYPRPEFEWLARKDPDFALARVKYGGVTSVRENPVLPGKYRALVAAVVLAFRGYPTVGDHIRRARLEGATMQEIVEAFEVATVPGGMPVLHFALPYLIEVEQEEAGAAGRGVRGVP